MAEPLERLRQIGPLRALALYGSASFVVLQVIDLFEAQLGLPDWVFQGSVVLLVVGLPIVLVTAWVQSVPHSAQQPPLTQRLRRWATWRRSLSGGVLAFAVMAMSAGGYGMMRSRGIGPAGSLLAKGRVSATDQVLIAPFTGDSTLASTVSEAFRIDFMQSRAIEVVRPDQLIDALRRMSRDPREPLTPEIARDVADREGFELLLRGHVAAAGTGYLLTAELVQARSSQVLAAFRETARDLDAVIPAIDRLSKKVRTRIGESLRTLQSEEPLARLTTASTAALRKAVEAQYTATVIGDFDKAIALYREAIGLDTTFAMAYRGLGNWIINNNGPRPEAIAALVKAYELRERLTPLERFWTEGMYHSNVQGDLDAAVASYRRAFELDPALANNLAYTLALARRFTEAESIFRSALARSKQPFNTYVNLIWSLVEQDKLAAADSVLLSSSRICPATRASRDGGTRSAWCMAITQQPRPPRAIF